MKKNQINLRNLKVAAACLLFSSYCLLFAFHYSFAEEQIFISAERLEFQKSKNLVDGSGNVEIRYKDKAIFGDIVEFNTETGDGNIKGNVVLSDPESYVFSESAEFNTKTATGTLYRTSGVIASKYYFTGEKMEKAGTDRYTILDGTLTTCCEDTPSWRFRIKKSHMHLEHYAYLTGTYLLIKDIPVLYLPYWIVPIKTTRATGFLTPSFGSSNKDGFIINNSFFWAINDHQDATIYLDYLEKKGLREGLEYRYIFSEDSSGDFSGFYLKEKDTERDFYKVNYDHNQLFSGGVQGVIKVDILSEANTDREYEDDTALRTRRYTDSHIRITKNWFSRSFQILGRKRESVESDYKDIYAQMPEITFANQKERIGETPFLFSMDSSITSFRNENNIEKIEIERADIHPMISYTFNRYLWLALTSSIGVRETYYSKGINRIDGFTRDLYDIELKMEGPKFFRIFYSPISPPSEGGERGGVKHIIEPRVVYNYIPDIDREDIMEIIQIDNIDAVSSGNAISYFLTNRILRKTAVTAPDKEEQRDIAGEVARLEISQRYDVTEATKENASSMNPVHPFSDLRFDIDTRLINPLIFNFDTTYDFYENRFNTSNLDIGIEYKNIWYVSAERRYTRKPESNFITGVAGVNLRKNLNLEYSSRYDELNGRFFENDYSTTYSSDCWEMSLDIVDRKYFIGKEERDETKFFFLITLKDVVSIGRRENLGLIQRKI